MSSPTDGGPAFPLAVDAARDSLESAGMSLRDYFAAAAEFDRLARLRADYLRVREAVVKAGLLLAAAGVPVDAPELVALRGAYSALLSASRERFGDRV